MSGLYRYLCIATLICACFCGEVSAQVTAQLSGTIADSSGALLPGVEITATNTATNTARRTISNETGSYVLPNLPLGPYTLEATLPGFSVFAQRGIVLQVGDSKVINVVLQVGQLTETVEVQSDALLVETRNTGIGQVLDNVRVLELPLNGRQVTELIELSGAVTTAPTGGTPRFYPTIEVSVGGGHGNMLSYRLDGGTHNDPFESYNMPLPFPDALQEFKVETSAIPARYGQHSAGLVSVVTKSGTNEFHGDAFEFVRNEKFNARNTFATERDSLKRNQFGGTIGGPIVRNKLFFFGGYQRTFKRSAPATAFAFVPTAEVLRGDFRRFASEQCQGAGRGVTLTAHSSIAAAYSFVNNQIDPARFSPAAVAIAKRLPVSSDPVCGRVEYGKLQNEDEHQVISRLDYQLSDRHSMFGRYTIHHLFQPSDYDGKVALDTVNPDYTRQYQSGVFGDTWSIKNNLINSFRLAAFRNSNNKTIFDYFSPPDVGITNIAYPQNYPKMMILEVVGTFNMSTIFATPSFTNGTTYEISDDFGWVRGKHQFSFGGSFLRNWMYISASTRVPGEWRFRSRGTGLPMADFLIGYVDRFQNEIITTWYPRQDFRSLYAQDTWKMNNRVTLNLGVRWEPFTPQVRMDNRTGRFQRDWFDQGRRSTVFVNAPKGWLYSGGDRPVGVPGDPGMPDYARISDNLWGKFAPRVGMAWDVSGDGRMSVRAAYGIFFDFPNVQTFNGLRNMPPFNPRVQRTNLLGGLDDPWTGYPGGNPFPQVLTKNVAFPPGATFNTLDADFRPPYVNQWNVSLQRQIGSDWMATANYMGNTTIHLSRTREANPLRDGVRELTRADPTSPYSVLSVYDDGGTANYNALWLSLERRKAGMNLRMNYTLSHCIDDDTAGSAGPQHLDRRFAHRGNCDLDRRHLFNMTTVYETPRFANTALRALASNWRISNILKLQSGSFVLIECGCDRSNTQESPQYPNQLLSNVFGNGTAENYLNPAAFALPAVGTYGNMGRNSVQGPGIFTLDMGLTRQFGVRENQKLEFRAEVFNLPNWVNLNNPDGDFSSTTFGRVTSARDPRIMQFALKYFF